MRRFRTMNTQLLHHMHELHSRISDGIHVRLLWSKQDDRVAVAVDDAKTGDAFTVDVRNGDRALDVFHHPYAYAALRGIDTRALVAASRERAGARSARPRWPGSSSISTTRQTSLTSRLHQEAPTTLLP